MEQMMLRKIITIVAGSLFLVDVSLATFSEEDKRAIEESRKWIEAESIVFSAAKKKQKISETTGAVFVITQHDIHRSGVKSVADALRMAPGVQVARYSSYGMAITIRGFNGLFSNKLLVMIDGRSVYDASFSGVYWDNVDLILEDVERIEVIRGSGGTLWGANAVNGVINIITKDTKDTKDTQGTLAVAGGGSEERGFVSLRHGGKINENTGYRVYGKALKRDELDGDVKDDWERYQLGFRMDGEPDEENKWLVQGNTYTANLMDSSSVRARTEGANVLTRWSVKASDKSDWRLQAYYDYQQRDTSITESITHTADFELQQRYRFNDSNEVIWGLGYRFQEVKNVFKLPESTYDPITRDNHIFSAFIQDEIALIPKTLKFIIGTKIEHNGYSGFEIQPNARLLWNITESTSTWAAVSRAVRTPSRQQHDLNFSISFGDDTFVTEGDENVQSESVISYEFGIRQQVSKQFSWDFAAFYSEYDDVVDITETTFVSEIEGQRNFITRFENNVSGYSYGAEIFSTWRPYDWWTLKGSYSYFQMKLKKDNDVAFLDTRDKGKHSPRNQVSLRSSMDFDYDVSLDLWLRYTDKIEAVNDYLELDARLAWDVINDVELSLVGQNLLNESHEEYPRIEGNKPHSNVQRSIYGQVRWKF
ncbi:MAG: TonB-dependent receptor [Methylococcales bacterium]|nr:TonB-dependent receptor [Methylococcales bacterium]